jgi:hypothetical protein
MTTIAVPDRWLFGGVDLSTYAQAVTKINEGGGLPTPRGANYLTPSLPGRRHVPKADDEDRIALALVVAGANAAGAYDGGVTTDADQAQKNLDALKVVFGRRHLLQSLVHVLPDGSQRTGQAKVADLTVAAIEGGGAFTAIVDFELPDPYLYGADVVDATRAIAASPTDFVLTHPGGARGHRVALDFLGPISNPRVTNLLTGVYVECLVTVAATKHLVIDCEAFTASNDGVYAGGSIRHSGDFRWLLLEPGAQTLRVTGTGLTGATRLTTTFKPPYHV